MPRTVHLVVLTAAAAGVLTACGSTTATTKTAPATSTGGQTHANVLSTRSTPLGSVIVGSTGHTVYTYGEDHRGIKHSACTGACASQWPAVTTTSTHPQVTGVSGKVATIPANGGGRQVTVNGWPVYYFAGDSAAGQTNGQNYDHTWWAVSARGSKITGAATSSPSPSSSGGSGGYGGY